MDIPSKDLAEALALIEKLYANLDINDKELEEHYLIVMNDIEKRYKKEIERE